METINKLDLKSMNISEDKKNKLKELFPEVFSEDKIDFEKLKLTLGEDVSDSEERFGLQWPGKKDCFKVIQEPSIGTLKPCKEESVNWDTTENIFIEGDNLEVLKLLQKSYYGKIKMIYIDPPYNTGGEFIYPDRFQENLETYLAYTGQVNDEGKKFSTNTETSGRFHSNWLNMMYPRLFLARNLLKNDGVIFISIDIHELDNLIKLGQDIFGEENYIGTVSVVNNFKGRSDDKYLATANEFLVVFKKNNFETQGVPMPAEYLKEYTLEDKLGKYRLLGLRKRGSNSKRSDRPNMFYPIYIDPKSLLVSLEKTDVFCIEVIPKLSDNSEGCWRWGRETFFERISELQAKLISGRNEYDIYQKDYLNRNGDIRKVIPKTFWLGTEFSSDSGTRSYKETMNEVHFNNPKPIDLIKYCCHQSVNKNDIVLDFFSGSCSSAHAILDLNKEDEGNRKFIMVQLPESCDIKSEAYKAGYKTIAEIGKERIRRVIKKIEKEIIEIESQPKLELEENKINKQLDLGFKVFKLDRSNFKTWQGDTENNQIENQLEKALFHIDSNSSKEDILTEIILKSGFELTVKIDSKVLANKEVFSIENDSLIICLDDNLNEEVIKEIAKLEPARVVCLDSGFNQKDELKANAAQILKSHGVEDFRTV